MNNLAEIIGLVAGFLTTVSFVPQVVRVYKTKSADDLSYGMLCLFILGIALWLTYGIILQALPVVIANAVTLCLALTLLVFKIKYR